MGKEKSALCLTMNFKKKSPIRRKIRRIYRHGYGTESKMRIERFYKKEFIKYKDSIILK